MKKIISVLIVMALLTILSCTKGGKLDGINGDRYSVISTASSRQLIPAIDTTSTGAFTGFYDDQTNILTFTVAWNDLWRDTKKDTITAVNFYGPGSASVNAPLVRSLPFVSTNKSSSINLGLAGGQGLIDAEKRDLLGGSYYFTIITKRYPAGIIRGQLAVSKK